MPVKINTKLKPDANLLHSFADIDRRVHRAGVDKLFLDSEGNLFVGGRGQSVVVDGSPTHLIHVNSNGYLDFRNTPVWPVTLAPDEVSVTFTNAGSPELVSPTTPDEEVQSASMGCIDDEDEEEPNTTPANLLTELLRAGMTASGAPASVVAEICAFIDDKAKALPAGVHIFRVQVDPDGEPGTEPTRAA